MPPPVPSKASSLPGWLVGLGSLLILAHLLAVITLVLAAPSGPWSTPFGADMALAPWFAGKLNEITTPSYLQPLKLTHNYHFLTNRTGMTGVILEARLRDEHGNVLNTLTIPDPNANHWVKHRQAILARSLGDDQPVQPQMGESVAAPNQQVKKVKIWEPVEGKQRELQLKEVPEHLVPRDRPVMKTSDWTNLLVRSYARHLGRVHNADSVEIIRRSQEPIPPAVLVGDPPPGAFDELISNFGRIPTSNK